MPAKKAVFAAAIIGFVVSGVLAAVEAVHHTDVIALAQFPGLVVAWEVAYGAHNLESMAVVIVVNATCYAVLFGGMFLLARPVIAICQERRVHE